MRLCFLIFSILSRLILWNDENFSCLRHPSYFGWFWWAISIPILLANPLSFVAYCYAAWSFFADRIPYISILSLSLNQNQMTTKMKFDKAFGLLRELIITLNCKNVVLKKWEAPEFERTTFLQLGVIFEEFSNKLRKHCCRYTSDLFFSSLLSLFRVHLFALQYHMWFV
jgi:hypothetical protein